MAETNTSTATTSSTILITVRLIKSFEFRTFKNLVFTEIPVGLPIRDLKQRCCNKIRESPGLKPYHSHNFDTFKLYVKAHGSKTSNLIINLDHDELTMDMEKNLSDYGVENETEISFYNLEMYNAFKNDPKVAW